MCQLIETILINKGEIYHLNYHQLRVNRSIGENIINLTKFINYITIPNKGRFKLRITYNEKEIENYTITPYLEKPLTTFMLIRDDNIKYDLKYSNRINIDKLWNLRQDCDDIIIVKNGNITDSRFANLVLFDGQKWLTPDTPLLNGTCRQRLIDEKTITPKRMTIEDLFHYNKLTTINAMIGFNPNKFIYISEKTIKR